MPTFIEIDSAAFDAFFQSHSFLRTTANNEVVYYRTLPQNDNITIKVYSSIREGNSTARDVGKDAIRVVAILTGTNGKTYPLFKGKRIHRTGSLAAVQQRVLERLTEATHRCEEWNVARGIKRMAEEEKPNNNWERERDQVMGAKEPPGSYDLCWKDIPFSEEHGHQKCVLKIDHKDVCKSGMQVRSESFTGKIGDEIIIRAKIVSRKQYGNRILFVMDGTVLANNTAATFTFWSDKDILQVGNEYRIRAVIFGHHTYNNTKQIEIANCRGSKIK